MKWSAFWSTALNIKVCLGLSLLIFYLPYSWAQQEYVEVETTVIRGNSELPKYLYIVPWRDRPKSDKKDHKIMLHNLYGDLFDPVLPDYVIDRKEIDAEAVKQQTE